MKWRKDESEFLVKNYGVIPLRELTKILNRSRSSIKCHARFIGLMSSLHNRLQTVNKDYFQNVNNENSYWAGMLAADGSIGKNDRISLFLVDTDIAHIQKFKNILDYSGPVFKKQNVGSFNVKSRTTGIAISCDEHCFSIDLKNNFNITNCKSLTLEPPNLINENHIRHYIRGYMDGDGWISLSNKQWCVGFCGTLSLLKWIKDNITKYVPNIGKVAISPKGVIFSWQSSGYQSKLILDWIYKDSISETRLDRKYQKYLQVIKFYQNGPKKYSSIYRGVFWNTQRQKWQASISINGCLKYLGSFSNEEEAAKAYIAEAKNKDITLRGRRSNAILV